MPRALIAEDEPLLRGELRSALQALWPELVVVHEAADGIEANRGLDEAAPDILFLDVQMPGMTGLDVARRASGKCHVVFVTAYDQYAVSAFEQGAVDYVLKPFAMARLAETVARLRARLEQRPARIEGVVERLAQREAKPPEYLRWVQASQGTSLSIITVDEVCYFKADHKYTLVMLSDAEALMRMPIKELAEQLDPSMFWQINRSTLLNVAAAAGVCRDVRGHLVVRLKERKETLPVSESHTHLFRQM